MLSGLGRAGLNSSKTRLIRRRSVLPLFTTTSKSGSGFSSNATNDIDSTDSSCGLLPFCGSSLRIADLHEVFVTSPKHMIPHYSPEADEDLIMRLDAVIESSIKTHEILEAKAKFGFTILSSAMALALFAYGNVPDLEAKVTVDAIRLFVLFDLLAVFSTLAVMWPRYQPIAIIQPKASALEKWRKLAPAQFRANLLAQYIKLWKQHEDVVAPKTSAFQAACSFTGLTFVVVAVILYQLTGPPIT